MPTDRNGELPTEIVRMTKLTRFYVFPEHLSYNMPLHGRYHTVHLAEEVDELLASLQQPEFCTKCKEFAPGCRQTDQNCPLGKSSGE